MSYNPMHHAPSDWLAFQDWARRTRVRCFHCGAANKASLMGRSPEGFHCSSNCFGQGRFRIPTDPVFRPAPVLSLVSSSDASPLQEILREAA